MKDANRKLTAPPSAGPCPICGREMFDDGVSTNRHHFLPKSKGGTATELVHRICHDMAHRLFSESELAREYSDPEKLRSHPDIAAFVSWVSKRHPLFVGKCDRHSMKGKRR